MRSMRITGRALPLGIAFAVAAMLLPLTLQEARANHGSRTLQVTPELNTRPRNETQVLTAHLSAPANAASGLINIDFEMETGSNDPDGETENSPETPDKTCIVVSGESECNVQYVGEQPGEDQWRVWIDHDGDNSTVEADAGVMGEGGEGRYAGPTDSAESPPEEEANPGIGDDCTAVLGVPTGEEPDCTDVIRITFQGNVFPGFIDCDDEGGPNTERAKNPAGGGEASNENTACFVYDQNGNPINDADPNTSGRQSTTMYGEHTGQNDPDDGESFFSNDFQCSTTTGNTAPFNRCFMTVTNAEFQQGTAEACFWAVGENDNSVGDAGTNHCGGTQEAIGEAQASTGADGPNDLGDRTEVTWEPREATGLDIETDKPEQAVGGNRDLVATVYDQFGDPFQGATTVNFEFFRGSPTDETDHASDGNSPGTVDESCTTVNSPTCTEVYSQATMAGRDLICAWIGADPTLKKGSRNNKGTCNDEKRRDRDDDEAAADQPEPTGDRIDVVSTVWTNDPPPTILECTKETKRRRVRAKHTVTCEATTNQPDSGVPNVEIDIEVAGANDKDDRDSKRSPDFHCITNANGRCSIKHGPGKKTRESGKTLYIAWIDANYHDGKSEADKDEQRNENREAGATDEPDTTDAVQVKWRKRRR